MPHSDFHSPVYYNWIACPLIIIHYNIIRVRLSVHIPTIIIQYANRTCIIVIINNAQTVDVYTLAFVYERYTAATTISNTFDGTRLIFNFLFFPGQKQYKKTPSLKYDTSLDCDLHIFYYYSSSVQRFNWILDKMG